jgi:hypothetical protein
VQIAGRIKDRRFPPASIALFDPRGADIAPEVARPFRPTAS